MTSTAEQIAHNLNTLGDKIAIKVAGESYSYAFLKEHVSAQISSLENFSKKGDCIGLQLSDDVKCYVGLLALLISGRTFVPVNEGFGITQSKFMIAASGLKNILAYDQNTFITQLEESAGVTAHLITGKSEKNVQHTASDLAYILFTSGSTGNPKGVPISHANLDHFIQGIWKGNEWSFVSEDTFLQPFNLSFDLFVFTVFLPFALGATVLTVPLDKITIYSAQLLKNNEITVSLLVPSTMKIINILSEKFTFESLRLSFFCGEALYASDLLGWIKSTPNAQQINIYGPTEATVAFTKYIWTADSMNEVRNDIVPIGKAFGKNELALLKNESELLLGGPQIFQEYIGTDKNPFVVQDDKRFYRSGDICEINENGNFLFIGRNDSQVKVNGFRIEISDVENKIKKVLKDRQIVVVHKKNENNLCSLHAFLTGPELENIRELLNDHVSTYMMPSTFQFIDFIPRNMNGKTDRKKLKTMIQL